MTGSRLNAAWDPQLGQVAVAYLPREVLLLVCYTAQNPLQLVSRIGFQSQPIDCVPRLNSRSTLYQKFERKKCDSKLLLHSDKRSLLMVLFTTSQQNLVRSVVLASSPRGERSVTPSFHDSQHHKSRVIQWKCSSRTIDSHHILDSPHRL